MRVHAVYVQSIAVQRSRHREGIGQRQIAERLRNGKRIYVRHMDPLVDHFIQAVENAVAAAKDKRVASEGPPRQAETRANR